MTEARIDQQTREAGLQAEGNARVDQLVRESEVLDATVAARLDQLVRESEQVDPVVAVRVDQLAREAWVPIGNAYVNQAVREAWVFVAEAFVNQLVREAWVPVAVQDCDPPDSYYLSLMTSQYQGATKFLGWLQAVLQILCDIKICVRNLPSNFNVDTAVGAQLDILGQLIGESRRLGFQPTGGVSPVLTDDVYRILLKAKIAQNQWDGQLQSLYGIWTALFPGGTIALLDNQNMTATIFLTGVFSSIVQDLIVNGLIIPRPEGVLYNFNFGALPAFGFDHNDAYIAGFDIGKWG